MNTPLTSAQAQRTLQLLASRPLVRLITEIDDNGAVPPRRLASTLPDLSPHQLRSASATARAHGLVRRAPGAGLELTSAGAGLADLYDAMARWARRQGGPDPVCEFSSRVQHVLDLLAPSLTAERADDTNETLARLSTLLTQWLAANSQTVNASEPEPVA
ncbi:regulator [Streptomyces albidoflavus]|uniref:regulator n=1 Tax=Streptomyces albidoflavus TaxID=1886 RepID=UPI00101E7EB4|nr:regulator [Streptomyces albidoflavus]RZD82203.1 regulator [Streptomyces albidoflavus]